MRFERDFHAMIRREARRAAPVRDRLLLPLPLEDLEKLRRPRRGHPVRVRRGLGSTRTSRERDDDRDVHLLREAHGLAEDVVGRLRHRVIGMQRVVVARQRADREPGVREHLAVLERARLVVDQRVDVEMIVAGPAPGADFNRVHLLERSHFRDHVLDVQRAVDGRE